MKLQPGQPGLENIDESTIKSAETHHKFSVGGVDKAQLHLDHALKLDAIRAEQALEVATSFSYSFVSSNPFVQSKRLLEESERLERERVQKVL